MECFKSTTFLYYTFCCCLLFQKLLPLDFHSFSLLVFPTYTTRPEREKENNNNKKNQISILIYYFILSSSLIISIYIYSLGRDLESILIFFIFVLFLVKVTKKKGKKWKFNFISKSTTNKTTSLNQSITSQLMLSPTKISLRLREREFFLC